VPIREGLARLEGVESIGERPDLTTGTCELRMKNGRLLDPQVFSKFIYDIRVGARLRGLEATVNGFLERQDARWGLRISGSNETLALAPLSQRVQQDTKTKKPQQPARTEAKAYKRLLAKSKGKAVSARVTGPLVKIGADLVLEVRQFELKH
jgi:hypothetical protein